MMEEKENKAVVDPFSEEAILASLPPEARGELMSYGAMEDKTTAELHEIMLHMREKYAIPPWHPFTYLMKRYAASEGQGAAHRDTIWAHAKYRHKEDFDPDAKCGTRSWCDVTLQLVSNTGKQYSTRIYVDPTRKTVWSPASETPRTNHAVQCYSDDGSTYSAYIRWEPVFASARKLLADGQLSGTCEYHTLKASEAAKLAWETRRRNREIGNVQPRKCLVRMKEPDKIVTPATAEKPSDQLDKRILVPMFELAKAKALELGMTETVKLWEEALHV